MVVENGQVQPQPRNRSIRDRSRRQPIEFRDMRLGRLGWKHPCAALQRLREFIRTRAIGRNHNRIGVRQRLMKRISGPPP